MRRCASVLAALLVAACVAPPQERSPFADPALTLDRAAATLQPGTTTKTQALALLGPGEAVPFDSGWEARVYRSRRQGAPDQELVLLFDPAGTLARLRTASVARAAP